MALSESEADRDDVVMRRMQRITDRDEEDGNGDEDEDAN